MLDHCTTFISSMISYFSLRKRTRARPLRFGGASTSSFLVYIASGEVFKMVWNYPEVCLEDMVKLLKGFVDILILASGYRTSGLPAHWDVPNIKNALQWGLFFERVLRDMYSSEIYDCSVRELGAALSEMKTNPLFPQGLANLSLEKLCRARDFVSTHLISHLSLGDSQLEAFVIATTEDGDDMNFTVQEFLKRQSAVSCILTLEENLDTLSNCVRENFSEQFDIANFQEKVECYERKENDFVALSTWNNWKSRTLTYFLNKRTVKLVSGASLIFSAPKIQWVKVLEQLTFPFDNADDVFYEKIELLLLGCVAKGWSQLLVFFLSIPYNSTSILEQHEELCNLLRQTAQTWGYNENTWDSKAGDVLEYLTELLSANIHHLLNVPPALVAAAIPSWSPLFRLYFTELEKQFKARFPQKKYCSCHQNAEKQHHDCELAEKLWCLYIFHILVSR